MRSPISLLALALVGVLGGSLVLGTAGEVAGPEDAAKLPGQPTVVGEPTATGEHPPVPQPPGEGGEPSGPSNPGEVRGANPTKGGPAAVSDSNAGSTTASTPGSGNETGRGTDEPLLHGVAEEAPRKPTDVVEAGPRVKALYEGSSSDAADAAHADVMPTPHFAADVPLLMMGGAPSRPGADVLVAIEQPAVATEAPAETIRGSFIGAAESMTDAAVGSMLDRGDSRPPSSAVTAFASGFLGRGPSPPPPAGDGERPATAEGEAQPGLLGGFLGGLR